MDIRQQAKELENASVEDALRKLSSEPEKGLSEEEAKNRIEQYGENAIEERHRNPVVDFLSNFWGPIPWMIEIAAVLAGAVQRWEEFGVIMLLLLINGGISYWHESRATAAIEALKKQLALEAEVLRDGQQRTIAARELVPGDIITIIIGDIIPADAKLLQGNLSVDESSLTGESLPVDKEKSDVGYSGTTVQQGEARAVVVATGSRTRFGRTVELVAGAKEISHFRQAVIRIGYALMIAGGVFVAVILAVSVLRGDDLVQVVIFSLGLTVASIPVALPAVLSVTMSIGAGRLARWKAIVSHLTSMDELAGLSVLCADKTGTLTKNELELQAPVVMAAKDKDDLVLAAALTARRDGGDPIDRAVLGGLENEQELDKYRVLDFRPFDPTRKHADADVELNGSKFTVSKGAPQAILALIEADEQTRERVRKKVDELGADGFRSLGVARKSNRRWEYLGILPLLDPPREDSAGVIRDAREHGIDIRMMTGDHIAIAKQVARQLGLGENIESASEIFGAEKAGEEPEISEAVLSLNGFAEVTPEHKFKIVKAFQARNHIVGMTGDGVNDAPALKQANVGIAVSGASDAARSAADLVLTAPGLGVITNAVEEARRIFNRMTSYAIYRVTETIRLLIFVAIVILIYNFFPVSPIMILLLAILNDIPIMAIAWDNVSTPPRPVEWDMRHVLIMAGFLGLSGVALTFVLFYYLRTYTSLSADTIQTLIFLKLLVAGHMTIFLTRARGAFWNRPFPSLWLLGALEGTQIAGTLIAVYGVVIAPIGWTLAAIVWGYALVEELVVLNAVKIFARRLLE